MTNLRKEARGRNCQVRLPGICNGNPETTVLAHYRMAGLNGMRCSGNKRDVSTRLRRLISSRIRTCW